MSPDARMLTYPLAAASEVVEVLQNELMCPRELRSESEIVFLPLENHSCSVASYTVLKNTTVIIEDWCLEEVYKVFNDVEVSTFHINNSTYCFPPEYCSKHHTVFTNSASWCHHFLRIKTYIDIIYLI